LSRGLAPRPEERWPDVDALCEALRFSKRKVRRRRALIAGVAAIGLLGTGIAVREVDRRRQVAACQSDAAALVDGVWIEGARERLESRLVGEAGVQGTESFERAATALDEALGEIEAEYRRVCVEAKVERSWGDHDYAKAVSCLQRVRDETAARVAWIDGVETSLMQVVVPMVQGLTDPAPCVDRIDLETQPEPFSDPDQRAQEARLSRLNLEASGSLHLGKLDEAGAAVAEMRQLAEQTGVERYRMMAMATSVEIHLGSENPEEARPDVEAAFIELGAGGFDEMALHAGAMLVYTVGARLRQPDAALVYVDAIRVLTSGLEGSAMEIERARLLDAEGAVHSMRGSLDKAIAAHEKGLEILEREYGSDHLDVAMTLTNLGADHYMAGNYDLSVEHMRRALAIRTARLGADHPTVLQARANLALVLEDVGRADESEKEFRALLPKLREAFGPVDGRLLATYMMLSRYALLREDFEEALEFAKLSQEVTELSYGARHPEMIDRLTDLGVTQYKKGDHEEGLRTLQSAVTLGNEILGTDRVDLGTPLEALAELAYDRGDPGQTIQWAEQALEAWATGEFPPAESAALRFLMAKALWDTGRDRERALSIARDVRDVLTGTESTYERETYDEAKAWLAEHEPLLDAEAR
jgi:tetratricopeptide (TPR) repeat protein